MTLSHTTFINETYAKSKTKLHFIVPQIKFDSPLHQNYNYNNFHLKSPIPNCIRKANLTRQELHIIHEFHFIIKFTKRRIKNPYHYKKLNLINRDQNQRTMHSDSSNKIINISL